MTDKRDFIRQDAIHLLDYLILDDQGQGTTYSMGRTLDVSPTGLKLETTHPLEPGSRLQVTVGLHDNLVDLTGTVSHSREERGRYISGIRLDKLSGISRRVFEIYTKAFRSRATAA